MVLVYDTSEEFGTLLLVLIVCGVGLWAIITACRHREFGSSTWYRVLVTSFVSLILLLVPLGASINYLARVSSLSSGKCDVVEGLISGFDRHGNNTNFNVGRRGFFIHNGNSGFVDAGIPKYRLRNGLYTRIHAYHGRILRYEVDLARSSQPGS
jgi:hypothetical protein